MYKGKQPLASKNPTTKSSKSESIIGKKSTTVIKESAAPKFSSFNNVIQTNQSIDMNSSRRQMNNQSPGNSMVLSGIAGNNSSSKAVTQRKYTNSYTAQYQEKQLNKSKNNNSKDNSLNASKRLATNTSVNNINSSKTFTVTEDFDHTNCAHTVSNVNANEKNCNFVSNISRKNMNNANFPKPPIDTNGSNNNAKNNFNSDNSNRNLVKVDLNLNNNIKKTENNQSQQQQQYSRLESAENKNALQNFTFNNTNNNMLNSNLNENSNLNNQSTNVNIPTGPGKNYNLNANNINSGSNMDSGNSNIYQNSKNTKQADGDKDKASPGANQNIYKNNSSSKITNAANTANNKAENIKKFADDIAKSKGKNNIYDIIKNTSGKRPAANSTDPKGNLSSRKNNNNTINNSIASNANNKINNNNNNNGSNSNKLLGSAEKKNIDNEKKNFILKLNMDNSQNLDNLTLRTSKNLNTSNQSKNATSNNILFSPAIKPIKNDQNLFNNLNGSLGFSSIELLKSPKNDEDEIKTPEKFAENATAAFNKYRNENKQKNSLDKKNPEELSNVVNNNYTDTNLNKNTTNNVINPNTNPESVPQEDDFNFNYNDEKIYSENQENSKKEMVEDDFDYFDKANNAYSANSNNTTNLNNKFNHNRVKSNTYLSWEPLTAIEEIDEKHNLLNTEENSKSIKEVNLNADGQTKQKEDNSINKVGLLNKKSTSNSNNNLININNYFDINKEENEKKKPNLQSLKNITNSKNSPSRKTNKYEAEGEELKKASNGTNAAASENRKDANENKKPEMQKEFNFKENININKDFDSSQNMPNNISISPINKHVELGLKKKNSVETELNLTPIIQSKDPNEIYKKGRVIGFLYFDCLAELKIKINKII